MDERPNGTKTSGMDGSFSYIMPHVQNYYDTKKNLYHIKTVLRFYHH